MVWEGETVCGGICALHIWRSLANQSMPSAQQHLGECSCKRNIFEENIFWTITAVFCLLDLMPASTSSPLTEEQNTHQGQSP